MPQLIDGEKVNIGGAEYVVPALSVRQLKKYRATLGSVAAFEKREPTDTEIDAVVEMVHAALQRNHPILTLDQLQDGLDMRNLPVVVRAIAGQTGLAQGKAQPGE